MKKKFIVVFLLLILSSSIVHSPNHIANFEQYDSEQYDLDRKSAQQQIKKMLTNSSFSVNKSYLEAHKNEHDYDTSVDFDMLLGVYYDPQYTLKYLENLPYNSNLSMYTLHLQYQLLVFWQIYRPEMIATTDYKTVAQTAHYKVMLYLSNKNNWQASWRDEEYLKTIGDDFQTCYADIKCLLDAIPYWIAWEIDMDVIIPCDVAQKYNKVWYYDIAGGGHGAQTFMTSTCMFDEKYDYPEPLREYIGNLEHESVPHSEGSIRFLFYAKNEAKFYKTKYRPDFEIEKQKDWTNFPYDEWSIESYYNFKKFNEVTNSGIGYKKATNELAKHYAKTFGVDINKAYNKALEVLKPLSNSFYQSITPNNLYYLLLTGADWSTISKVIPEETNYAQLLEFSVAYPQNLSKIIQQGKQNKDFTVNAVNEFGKTPLMLAAQYGYLDSIKLLLDNGADINSQTNDSYCYWNGDSNCQYNANRTAVMYAAQEGQYEALKYLLEAGADITLLDSRENTAYQYLLGQAPTYKSQGMTIAAGNKVYNDNPQSPFSEKQLEELKPLLEVK